MERQGCGRRVGVMMGCGLVRQAGHERSRVSSCSDVRNNCMHYSALLYIGEAKLGRQLSIQTGTGS